MTGRRIAWYMTLVVLLLGGVSGRKGHAAPNVEPYSCALVVTVDNRATLIFARITLDGEKLGDRWKAFMASLFKSLDRDDDGRLNAAETRRAPSIEWLTRQLRGDFVNIPEATRVPQEWFDGKEFLAKDEFIAPYNFHSVRGVDLRPAPPAKRERLDRALFHTLSGDTQQPLTAESFKSAGRALRRYDLDDDELLTVAELRPGWRALPAAETAATLQFFAKTDANQSEPIEVQLGLLTSPDSAHTAERPRVLREAPGLRWLLTTPTGAGPKWFLSARRELQQSFETDDGDSDGSLSPAEMAASENDATWRAILGSEDAQKSLSAAEREAYLDRLAAGAALRVEIMLLDHGRALFAQLDRDGDERLSPRELRHGWEQVRDWDQNRDGQLHWEEIPHEVELVVSHGPAVMKRVVENNAPQQSTIAIPKWFRQSDRNGDGDLSPREFLGPLEVFRRLDRDGDELLDAVESTVKP